MKPIIEVNGLWKEYQRGAQKEKYLSLRENLLGSLKPKKKDFFWALQDINFKVEQGDSLAIIGKNGAGKSTLLKILSKITPPTKGEITLRGRLASLLEVGTGFHPELTGRENIYLNGSILGLGKREINKQFDAIVDFSGVEAFLDTPLKHYSSGMQLRLAFAVAAHLEPEILVIDEVLAVGDSAFQKKCIDKMTEVSQSGRTLLFVSHNMQAIKNLCQTAILLELGGKTKEGSAAEVLNHYTNKIYNISGNTRINLQSATRKDGKQDLRIKTIQSENWQIKPGESFSCYLELETKIQNDFKDLLFGIAFRNSNNQDIIHLSNHFINEPVHKFENNKLYSFTIPDLPLSPGNYSLTVFLKSNEEIQDWIEEATSLQVLNGNRYNFSNTEMIKGLIQPHFKFKIIDNANPILNG